MIHEVLFEMVPNDVNSVARLLLILIASTVAYIAAVRRTRRKITVQEPERPLAARIRARMRDEPEIVQMGDPLLERIAGCLAPVPSASGESAEQAAGE